MVCAATTWIGGLRAQRHRRRLPALALPRHRRPRRLLDVHAAGEQRRHRDIRPRLNMLAVNEWLHAAIAGLGGDLELSAEDMRILLDLAAHAAHESGNRIDAPLVCYLVGRLQGDRDLRRSWRKSAARRRRDLPCSVDAARDEHTFRADDPVGATGSTTASASASAGLRAAGSSATRSGARTVSRCSPSTRGARGTTTSPPHVWRRSAPGTRPSSSTRAAGDAGAPRCPGPRRRRRDRDGGTRCGRRRGVRREGVPRGRGETSARARRAHSRTFAGCAATRRRVAGSSPPRPRLRGRGRPRLSRAERCRRRLERGATAEAVGDEAPLTRAGADEVDARTEEVPR